MMFSFRYIYATVQKRMGKLKTDRKPHSKRLRRQGNIRKSLLPHSPKTPFIYKRHMDLVVFHLVHVSFFSFFNEL